MIINLNGKEITLIISGLDMLLGIEDMPEVFELKNKIYECLNTHNEEIYS